MKLSNVIILLLCLANSLFVRGDFGCMDNSRHLHGCFDHKEYHLVKCNCPCWKYKSIANRGKCLKCMHYHDAQPMIVVSYCPETIREAMNTTQVSKEVVNETLAELFGNIDWNGWRKLYE